MEQMEKVIELYEKGETYFEIAKATGLTPDQVRHRIRHRRKLGGAGPQEAKAARRTSKWQAEIDKKAESRKIAESPDDVEPIDQLIERRRKNFARKEGAAISREWFPVKMRDNKPIAIAFVGDPHLDDNGCNWPLLEHDLEIMNGTEGMYAVNIGDTTNNWRGRLAALAKKDSVDTLEEYRLAEWFLKNGPWLVHVLGNHDLWAGDPDPLTLLGKETPARFEAWNAKFEIQFPKLEPVKVWAAHDFPGHSIYNPTHGQKRMQLHSADIADVYVAGHRHYWQIVQTENDHTNKISLFVRVRGYKYIDDYAEKLGHGSQQHGATVAVVIDPSANGPGRIQAYACLNQAAYVLKYLRNKPRKK